MQLTFTYDPSTSSAPSGFVTALNYVAAVLDALITNPITVSIAVGWGEIGGTALSSRVLAQGGPAQGGGLSYAQMVAALSAHAGTPADSQALAALPAAAPAQIPSYYVSPAQQKALGLIAPNAPGSDGMVGFGNTFNFSFDPNAQNVAGAYGFIGVAEHEITHALGRIYGDGALELVTYSAPGVLAAPNSGGYFSLDGGVTSLGAFSSAGDTADWASSATGDAFSQQSTLGMGGSVLANDTALLGALGFAIQGAATPVPPVTAAVVPYDFAGGTTSDILFQDAATGDIRYLTMGTDSWVDLGSASSGYAIVGVGDFNGDGVTDILFRNTATGETGFLANHQAGASPAWVDVGRSSTAYSIVGGGDFNGDGTTDLVFQNAVTGDIGIYLLNPGGANTWQGLGSPSLLYSVVAVGDFTGNGNAGILFRDTATGDAGFYQVGAGGGQGEWVGIGTPSAAYAVVGVGDFTGAGTSDILFRNNVTGDTGYLAMLKGGSPGGWVDLGLSSAAYAVVGVGDFAGNGISDILFRDGATGDTGFLALPPGGGTGGTWHGLGALSTAYAVVASPTFG